MTVTIAYAFEIIVRILIFVQFLILFLALVISLYIFEIIYKQVLTTNFFTLFFIGMIFISNFFQITALVIVDNTNCFETGSIIGGQGAKKNEFPWQAALVDVGEDEPFCGGNFEVTNQIFIQVCQMNQRQITLRIVGYHFSSRMTATLNPFLIYFKITCVLAILLEHMHKKLEIIGQRFFF